MEIVLGILLFFGAFTLGTVTSDTADHDTLTARVETVSPGHHEQAVAASPLQNCQASGSAKTYRDLTVPYARPVEQKPVPASDCEVDCWDD